MELRFAHTSSPESSGARMDQNRASGQAQKERMKRDLKSQMQVLVQANKRAEKEIASLKQQGSVSRCNRLVAELKQDLAEQDLVIEALRKELCLRGACHEEIDEALHRQLFQAERAPGATREQLKGELKEARAKLHAQSLQLEKERSAAAKQAQIADRAKELARKAVRQLERARNGGEAAPRPDGRHSSLETVAEVAEQDEEALYPLARRTTYEAERAEESDTEDGAGLGDGRSVDVALKSFMRAVPLQDLTAMVNHLEELLLSPGSHVTKSRQKFMQLWP